MKRNLIQLLVIVLFATIVIQGETINPDRHLAFWDQNAGTPSERFELAKRSTPELIAFVRPMPKGGDLHNHVSGATYSDYILDRAQRDGFRYDPILKEFTKSEKEPTISIEELKNNDDYLYSFLDAASLRGWHPGVNNGHDHFFNAFNHINTGKGSPEEMIVEMLLRNRYENVQYLELMVRCIPDNIPQLFREALTEFQLDDLEGAFKQVQPLLEKRDLAGSLKNFLDQRDQKIMNLLKENRSITGSEGELVVRYIAQLYRKDDPRSFFLWAVPSFWAAKTDNRVVGITLVAPEDSPESRHYFSAQVAILDFLWRKMGQPNINLHAGELELTGSPLEPMMNRIRQSIEKGHSRRIGHGVSIAWEKDLVDLLFSMRDNGIMVEVCLSSNESILGIEGKDHPFSLYRRAGVPVSINTDDEGISRSNLTMEYIKAIQRYDLGYQEVKDLVRNSLEYSFLQGQSLYLDRNYSRLAAGFSGVRAIEWQPCKGARKLMKKSPKLQRQVVLERAFVKFEQALVEGFRNVDR